MTIVWNDVKFKNLEFMLWVKTDYWEHLPFVQKFHFRQMVLVFFGTENRNGIELYHFQNTGKFFAFSRNEAWH